MSIDKTLVSLIRMDSIFTEVVTVLPSVVYDASTLPAPSVPSKLRVNVAIPAPLVTALPLAGSIDATLVVRVISSLLGVLPSLPSSDTLTVKGASDVSCKLASPAGLSVSIERL